MIRKLLLSALSLGIIAGAYAQDSRHNFFHLSPRQIENRKMVRHFLKNNPSLSGLAHKPTAIKQRVIAQAFDIDGEIDSTTYSYSGTNGSAFDYNNFYELSYSTEFIPDMKPAYLPSYMRASTDIKAGTINSYGDDELYYQASAFYNASGKMDSVYSHDVTADFYPFKRLYLNYNGEGHFGSGIAYMSSDDMAYELESKREITYSSPGRISGDSIFSYSGSDWTLSETYAYHYNSEGRADTITYEDEKYVYTYLGDGRVSTIRNYVLMMDGELNLLMSDSFGYTTGIDYVTYFQEIYYFGDMIDGTKILQYPGDGGRPDSLEMYSFDEDVWIKSAVARYRYNSFNNPESISIEGTDDGEPVSAQIRFYYEEYDDGTSLEDIADSKSFSVYPNPFRNYLTINYAGKDIKGTVSWKLADITGREVFKGTLNLQQGANRIDIPEIAPGNYIITLRDASGKTWASKLVRQ